MMTRSGIIEELEATLKSDKRRWRISAFERAVSSALVTLSFDRPLTNESEILLHSGIQYYAVPDDFIGFHSTDWGTRKINQWEANYPGVTPAVYVERSVDLQRLAFSKAPNAKLLAAYGADFRYLYKTAHQLSEVVCTVSELDAELLMTACQMHLVKELVAAHVTDPVQMHNAMSDVPREATPAVAYQLLKRSYQDLLHDGYRGVS